MNQQTSISYIPENRCHCLILAALLFVNEDLEMPKLNNRLVGLPVVDAALLFARITAVCMPWAGDQTRQTITSGMADMGCPS